MKPHNTQYSKDYSGENAHSEVHRAFYELSRQIDNLGIPLRQPKTQPYFEKDGKNLIAEDLVLLADEMPLAEVYLRATKWGEKHDKKLAASISLNIRHFKGPNPNFRKIEEIVDEFDLISTGTSLAENS